MKNRLEVAKGLLTKDGLIFVQCDDNEQAYLKTLMDEIFERENFIATIVTLTNRSGRDYGGIARTHDYIHVYSKTFEYALYEIEDKNKEFPYEDKLGGFEIWELRNRNIRFNKDNRPNLFYPFYVNPKKIDENELYELSLDKKSNWIEVLPRKSQGIQTVWRWGKEKASKELNINVMGKRKKDGDFQIIQKYREIGKMARSIWDEKDIRNEKGTLEIKKLFDKKLFDYPKAEELIKKVIEIGTKEGDIVLDYHLGSGTTCAVAHKMNRQYIGIEQLHYEYNGSIPRMVKIIGKQKSNGKLSTSIEDYDTGGISESVKWKGGGNFIYCELARYNEDFIEKIGRAKDTKELLKIWLEMKEKSFINYNVDIKTTEEHIEDFKKIPVNKQKEILISILNKNQLYINLSEIEDSYFRISKEDKILNKKFYSL